MLRFVLDNSALSNKGAGFVK